MYRLFVAIDLPPAVKEQLRAIAFGVPGAKWTEVDQIHLTLRFIGEVEGARFLDIREALSMVGAAPFLVRLKGTGHFPPRKAPRILWVGIEPNDSLLQLRNKVEAILTKTGLEPEGRKFSPHITLARLKDTPANKAAAFLAANALFETAPFEVSAFHLYSSVLTSKGANHQQEASYPLSTKPLGDGDEQPANSSHNP